MILAVVFLFVLTGIAAKHYQYIQLPMKYRVSYDKSVETTTDDVYECSDYCAKNEVLVFYYYTNGSCIAIRSVVSYTIETSDVLGN
ncbi:unnamed protein product [Bursaphelenchus xylophilus]|uniref:(pine wood nematode) hypothetical protein n=1 Tax=Bursaphelenchus xylophilus TaxID=6326 RepID=A0A7I8XQL7_BURXY|nr:unnamed protein product [Bursaphelenchus xylophilus]CAG9087745.1 unnamed protein product [Bursaphelenchus xylophilus]